MASAYVPTRSLARHTCQAAINVYVSEQPLHKGRKGKASVYPACFPQDRANCPYVIKIKDLFSTDDLERFLKEQFFAQYVYEEFQSPKRRLEKQVYSGLPNITPRFYDTWVCHTDVKDDNKSKWIVKLSGHMIMDRMDGTLRQFFERHALTLTAEDYAVVLQKLYWITLFLVDIRVFHRNITVDNIVYRKISASSSLINPQSHPGPIDLFLIDWDDIVWNANGNGLEKQYAQIIANLVGDLQGAQAKGKKIEEKVEIPSSTRLPEFTEFKAILAPPLAPSSIPVVSSSSSVPVFSSTRAFGPFRPATIVAPPLPLPITQSSLPEFIEGQAEIDQESAEEEPEFLPPV